MPQAMRSCLSEVGGWSGCSAWDKAICSKEKPNFTRSFAAKAAFNNVAGCNSFSPIAARICIFMVALVVFDCESRYSDACGDGSRQGSYAAGQYYLSIRYATNVYVF